MRFLRNRWTIAAGVLILVLVPSAWVMARSPAAEDTSIVSKVKKGDFKVTVTTSGELRAVRFVRITAPPNAQAAQQWQMKISSLVPEGTVVKAGDIVAELDRSGIAARLTEVATSLTKAQAQYEQAELDSTLNLSKAREDIKTMELGLEEKRLAKEQAVYEAPTVKRQAEIDYEKADRALAQAKKDYVTKTEQAKAKMREVGAERDRYANQVKVVQDVMQGFTIRAPGSGMVIYEKEWNGKKRTVGSQIGAWEPTVATLPDLSAMESQTYVNEIDIRKIAIGQKVDITLDSDPSKRFTGTVTQVANVGEQRPNTDAKVFEVHVLLSNPDTTLRPGMTTSNKILTATVANALYVPIEAISADSGTSVVYKRDGSRVTKQEVETGTMSDDEVVVLQGLAANDKVMLTPPAEHETMKIAHLTGPRLTPRPLQGDTVQAATLQGKPKQ
ncbi:MAG TPA: efflux RND transporter periplasmic adaptor subunit [Gemmatimonadaceae bacterium]|nr:efflux RND transporter periplasmic adaptor subunit [Gemmatimonadaceae bacterium]